MEPSTLAKLASLNRKGWYIIAGHKTFAKEQQVSIDIHLTFWPVTSTSSTDFVTSFTRLPNFSFLFLPLTSNWKRENTLHLVCKIAEENLYQRETLLSSYNNNGAHLLRCWVKATQRNHYSTEDNT